mgnify:CR=1 FL=1
MEKHTKLVAIVIGVLVIVAFFIAIIYQGLRQYQAPTEIQPKIFDIIEDEQPAVSYPCLLGDKCN